jgi:hypothetical protein
MAPNRLACISGFSLVSMRGLPFDQAHDSVSAIRYQLRVCAERFGVRQQSRVKARDSLYHLDVCSALFDNCLPQSARARRRRFSGTHSYAGCA